MSLLCHFVLRGADTTSFIDTACPHWGLGSGILVGYTFSQERNASEKGSVDLGHGTAEGPHHHLRLPDECG